MCSKSDGLDKDDFSGGERLDGDAGRVRDRGAILRVQHEPVNGDASSKDHGVGVTVERQLVF